MGETLVYAPMPVAEYGSEEPTSMLRWKGGVLQQKWRLITYQSGRPVDGREEWRDVPTED